MVAVRANNNERALSAQTEAARDILAILADNGADDDESRHDAVEGETGLLEAIAAVMSEIDQCEAHIFGLEAKRDEYETRIKLIGDRKNRLKAAIEQAMLRTEMETLRLDVATLSIRKTPPKLIVENEALIPARFWNAGAPKLDRTTLTDALKSEKIEGASLSNGGITLSIRRR